MAPKTSPATVPVTADAMAPATASQIAGPITGPVTSPITGPSLSLSQRIAPGADPLLTSPDGRTVARADLAGTGLTAQAAAALGGKVALVITDPALFIRALVALDGRVAAVVLLSYALGDDTVATLVRQAGCTGVLTDRPEALAPVVAAPVVAAQGVAVLAAEAALGADDAPAVWHPTTWFLTTSGTTGLPKIISHTLTGLAHKIRPMPPEKASPVWGHMIDPTRFSGLLLVLQALIGGGRLILADSTAALGAQLAALAAGGVTHLTGAPTLWRRILMQPGHQALALAQVTLVGEIADEGTLRALAVAWPAARISHIYGSTEAGQGFSVSDGRAGFPAAWLAAGPGGLTLDIRDGVLWLQPPEQARDAPHTGTGAGTAPGTGPHTGSRTGIEADAAGFIRTGDLVEVQGDLQGGRVIFLGRESGLINVAGVKVWPEVVEAVIKAVPGVGLVQVSARKSPVTGALVLAEVQASDGVDTAALRLAILAACRAALPREAVPATLRFVAALPSNAAGKLLRTTP